MPRCHSRQLMGRQSCFRHFVHSHLLSFVTKCCKKKSHLANVNMPNMLVITGSIICGTIRFPGNHERPEIMLLTEYVVDIYLAVYICMMSSTVSHVTALAVPFRLVISKDQRSIFHSFQLVAVGQHGSSFNHASTSLQITPNQSIRIGSVP